MCVVGRVQCRNPIVSVVVTTSTTTSKGGGELCNIYCEQVYVCVRLRVSQSVC